MVFLVELSEHRYANNAVELLCVVLVSMPFEKLEKRAHTVNRGGVCQWNDLQCDTVSSSLCFSRLLWKCWGSILKRHRRKKAYDKFPFSAFSVNYGDIYHGAIVVVICI